LADFFSGGAGDSTNTGGGGNVVVIPVYGGQGLKSTSAVFTQRLRMVSADPKNNQVVPRSEGTGCSRQKTPWNE